MSTVHFVYPRDLAQHASPYCIGNEVGNRLQRDYEVRFYDWREATRIRPAPGDVLLGHPHRRRDTAFNLSAREPGFARRLVMTPFGGELKKVAHLDPLIERCDLYLAITGGYWFERIGDSPLARWAPKMRHLDLAVNPAHFPRIKAGFNPPGRRRFVYIGNTASYKNVGYLTALQAARPEARIAWIGRGRRPLAGVEALGFQDFRTESGRAAVAPFDFLLTVGRFDANPTTILEAMAWGLVPVCTPQSGYENCPGIVNLPLDDVDGAAAVLLRLQRCPAEELMALQDAGRAELARHYQWDRFYDQVRTAIESTESPPLAPAPWLETLRMRTLALFN